MPAGGVTCAEPPGPGGRMGAAARPRRAGRPPGAGANIRRW
jgi:hypothetical protein